jgi:hypothetical protein
MKAMRSAGLAAVFVVMIAGAASAQESKSAPLAKQLAAAMDAAKLDSFAVKDPSTPFTYVGVFYLPGAQLLVVSGRYSAPMLIEAKLSHREYKDAYVDLNSATDPASRTLIEDAGADGLKAIRSGTSIDAVSAAGKRVQFDTDWKKQQITEADYKAAYGVADDNYARMLKLLVAAVSDPSVKVAAR